MAFVFTGMSHQPLVVHLLLCFTRLHKPIILYIKEKMKQLNSRNSNLID